MGVEQQKFANAWARSVRAGLALQVSAHWEDSPTSRSWEPRELQTQFRDQTFGHEEQILLEDEFWDIVGRKGTFNELLEIYREVGREKGRQVMDRLGYNG